MIDFDYCIWFQPKNDHEWYDYTNGFEPHVTLKTNLTYSEAHEYVKNIKIENIDITLQENPEMDCSQGFHAIYYNLVNKHHILPDDAHVSFMYQYDKPFSINQIEQLGHKIKARTATLSDINIVKCTGHFRYWKKI